MKLMVALIQLNENRVFEVNKLEKRQFIEAAVALNSNDKTTVSRSSFDHFLSKGAATLLVVTSLALIATPASARWYKWVDEDGNISYQDRPPPSNYEESAQVLNSSGVTVKTIPSKQEQIEMARIAKIRALQRQRDDALLKTFSNESDLIETRDKRVVHIDSSVARMYDQLVILNGRLASIDQRVDQRIERKLAPSQALESDRIAVIRSIDSTDALIKAKLRERRMIMSQFDNDLVRYRELKGTSTARLND